MRSNLELTTKVAVFSLLELLRKNRANHVAIVKEAREGYVRQAKESLLARLDALQSGKLVSLSFSLSPPAEQTDVYDTAIRMLEMTVDKEIVLNAAEFHNLVEDKWDWSRSFYALNKAYSVTASKTADELGF